MSSLNVLADLLKVDPNAKPPVEVVEQVSRTSVAYAPAKLVRVDYGNSNAIVQFQQIGNWSSLKEAYDWYHRESFDLRFMGRAGRLYGYACNPCQLRQTSTTFSDDTAGLDQGVGCSRDLCHGQVDSLFGGWK